MRTETLQPPATFDGRTGSELPGTSSRDLDGRDSTSAGARILCGLRRQRHLTNHIALPIARTSMRAIARGVPPPVRGRSPDRGLVVPRNAPRRSASRSCSALHWARRDRFRFAQALLANGSLVLVGTLAHVLVADDIRAGMEVMPRRGSEDAGGLRARRCSQLLRTKDRADPRRSHQEGRTPRLPSSA